MSASLAIQKAVFDRLKGNSFINTKTTGVSDGFPEQKAFPYITIGDANVNPFTSFGHFGEEVFLSVHIWSRYKGSKEALEIGGKVIELLAHQQLTVTGFGSVPAFFESSQMIVEDDGITRHLFHRYRFIIQH